MRNATRFLWNTIILTATSVLMRILAMCFQIYMTQRIGAAGIGLYELLMSVYGFAVSLAVSGIKLSTTRLVLEMTALKKDNRSGVMRLCLLYALALGGTAGVLLYLFSSPIASIWMEQAQLAASLRVLAYSLPFLSMSSCLSGYFAAKRKAGRSAAIQVLEFVIHMGLTAGGLLWLKPEEPLQACFLLVCCSCISDAFSACVACLFYRREGEQCTEVPFSLLPDLLRIAVPDAVASWMRSGLVSAKHLLIPKGLRQSGASSVQALAAYGVVQGMVMPIIGFPAAFLGTISGLLIPEIAESKALGQTQRLFSIMQRVLHLTLIFSFFAAGILLVYSKELANLLYQSSEAQRYLCILAPIVPVMYLDTTVDGMLKGLGMQNASMRINILDAAISLILVWQLIPQVGMAGYLLIIYMSELLNFVLSFHQLQKYAGLWISFYRSVLAPLLASMCAILIPRLFPLEIFRMEQLNAVWVSIILYYGLLRLLGSISRQDRRWFQGLFIKK